MNSRNNSYRGFGFYLVLILIVVGVWYFLDGNTTTNSYTRAAFEKDIQSGDVTAIDIVQNREIPTGSVNLTFSDSTQKVLIVSAILHLLGNDNTRLTALADNMLRFVIGIYRDELNYLHEKKNNRQPF